MNHQEEHTLVYDGSFEGFLTAIFHIYEIRLKQVNIRPKTHWEQSLFGSPIEITTEEQKTERVWNGLKKKLSSRGTSNLHYAFLSEESSIEDHLLGYIRYALASPYPIDSDFTNPHVLKISQIAKSVGREKHRMEAFVRLRLSKDNIYFATIEPDYNVLPLITKHFKSRYADQQWIIYDVRRNYGMYYNLEEVAIISIDFPGGFDPLKTTADFFASEELEFQALWKNYFDSTNIPARKNPKLHVQHVPKRYWKYLSEKAESGGFRW